MKLVIEITKLESNGEMTTIDGQGNYGAAWLPQSTIHFRVPEYVAKRYAIGSKLTVTVTPKPPRKRAGR